MATITESPLARLSAEEIEALAEEFDAIHDEVVGDLGDRDRTYITSMIEMHRRLAASGRVVLFASRLRPAWLLGTGLLSLAKILETMEIGHDVMHGQWDWMNDPDIRSSTWDWDTASTGRPGSTPTTSCTTRTRTSAARTRTSATRSCGSTRTSRGTPVYLAQPLYNVLLMACFEWGVASHDLDFEAIRTGDKSLKQANLTANTVRNLWSHAIIFCGHAPDQAYTFAEEEVADETRGGFSVRQLPGAAMPSTCSAEIAPRVQEICARYGLPYTSGPFPQQWFRVERTIAQLAFPGGRARPKPGPYRGAGVGR